MTPSGDTPNDGLYANGPWRTQAQQLPACAGPPATFAPTSRAATLSGTPQSANSQQAPHELGALTISRLGCK
eukprot:3838745-Pyramimonas_sp.AAC.1